MRSAFIAGLVLFLFPPTFVSAQPAATLPSRPLKYPLKTARTMYTDAQIAIARENIHKYPAAAAVEKTILKNADDWVNWKDEDLRFLLTSSDVPRAFAVSASGCPVCGGKILAHGGDYSWIIDPKLPFKVKCPEDGTVFPTNDYAAYYRSGFKKKIGWDTQYVDDGHGWKNPKTGEKFWFVAYYNHWMWHKYLVPGLHSLSEAYLLTGDKRYAHKAAVMLERIAEVYPGMNYTHQSRYGEMLAAQGRDYPGKVVNAIWETALTQALADSYDAVWDSIDTDAALAQETGKTGQQIRSFIEANILEDGIDAYFAGKIRGNFGMHQSALVHLALVRQTGPTKKWFDGLMNASASTNTMLGLNFALYNLIGNDGMPSEASPGYNFLWVEKISDYGDLFSRGGIDVFAIPRMKRLYDCVLDQINARQFTPDTGDNQSVWGGLTGANPQTFETAYRHYHDPRYLAFLAKLNALGENGFKTFDSLCEKPINAPADQPKELPPQKSRLLAGGGWAILNDAVDRTSLALTFGQHRGHGHFDRLNIELFANGQPIMPDLGYPDAMNDFVPGIYAWSKNTISHNTVTVDAGRQRGEAPGRVRLFADSPFARIVEIDAPGTYPQCSRYRRTMLMIDAGRNQSYFIDLFDVRGGNQHDYSLHGPPGEFKMIGGTWSAPAKGTLAGENVAIGQMYDDPKLGAKNYKGGFNGYAGSGFQYLFNVRALTAGAGQWVGQWKHGKDPHSMLRIRVLDQPGQQMMLCDAHVSPAKYPEVIQYLIAREQGTKLSSRFVSMIEPFRDAPFIRGVKRSDADGAVKLDIERLDGKIDEVICEDDKPSISLRTLADGKLIRSFQATNVISGKVIAVDVEKSTVDIACDAGESASFAGKVVRFDDALGIKAHTVTSADPIDGGVRLHLLDDVRVGLARIGALNKQSISTSTALPLAPSYPGCVIADEQFHPLGIVSSVNQGRINSQSVLPADQSLKPGKNVWLLDVGVGDTCEVPMIVTSQQGE